MKPDLGRRFFLVPFVSLMLLVLALPGCKGSSNPAELDEASLAELGELPGATQAVSQSLRDELARIREEGGLPTQLAAGRPAEPDNLSLILAKLFSAAELPELVARVDHDFPAERFTFSPIALEKVIRLRTNYDSRLMVLADALHSPQRVLVVDHRQGFLADRWFIDACRVAVSLEAYRVAEQLAEDRVAEALATLRLMFELVQRLAVLKHVEARLEAVELRSRSFQVLQAVVDHPQMTVDLLMAIQLLIDQQLARWPPDGDAWVGDRAMGLHAYELVRRGALLQLLTEEELARFSDEGTLDDLQKAARRFIDQDEEYYLQTMRTIIEACRKPYAERIETFADIYQAQNARRNEPDFPLLAARVFLPNIEQAQRQQAEDRALVESWSLALRLALGGAREGEPLDPATGRPYRVSLEPQRVTVWADSWPDRPAVVPVLEGP